MCTLFTFDSTKSAFRKFEFNAVSPEKRGASFDWQHRHRQSIYDIVTIILLTHSHAHIYLFKAYINGNNIMYLMLMILAVFCFIGMYQRLSQWHTIFHVGFVCVDGSLAPFCSQFSLHFSPLSLKLYTRVASFCVLASFFQNNNNSNYRKKIINVYV